MAEEVRDHASSPNASDAGGASLERKLTNTETAAIQHPGDVRINVKGAFIVDNEVEETSTPGEDFDGDGYQHDRKDIRLPNHKAVVSHIAVDVCVIFFSFTKLLLLARCADRELADWRIPG